jgi:putative acetyltransferase
MIEIRTQIRPDDLSAIKAINTAAFAEHGGTGSFDAVRAQRDDIISLVAETQGRIVGHVLFSPVHIETPRGPVSGMGLGQLAVEPACQKQGIGTQLSTTGINELRARACPFVIVIGHATYYPRFGFEACVVHDIQCQWDNIPDETFMVLFPDGKQRGLTGTASFDGL